MSVRTLAVVGLTALAVGGPLLLLGLPHGALGAVGTIGVAASWLGVLLVTAAMVQLGRIEHRMLRAQGRATRELLDAAERDRSRPLTPELLERLTALENRLDERLDAHQHELRQAVDARILGIHATVRDVVEGRSGTAAPRDPA